MVVPPAGGLAAIGGASPGAYASAVNSMRETWSGSVSGTLARMMATAATARAGGASGRRFAKSPYTSRARRSTAMSPTTGSDSGTIPRAAARIGVSKSGVSANVSAVNA